MATMQAPPREQEAFQLPRYSLDAGFPWFDLRISVSEPGECNNLRTQGNTALSIAQDELELLQQIFDLRAPDPIRVLIDHKPILRSLLFEAYEQVQQVFGCHVKALAIKHYVDLKGENESLTVVIQTDLGSHEAMQLLSRLDDEWYLHLEDEVRAYVTFIARSARHELRVERLP